MRRMTSLVLVLALIAAFQPAPLFGALAADVEQSQLGSAISGVAQTAPQQPLVGFTVRLRNIDTGSATDIPSTTTNAAGEFSFSNVNQGNYIIEVVGPDGGIVGTSATVVTPGMAGASGVTITATLTLVQASIAAAVATGAAAAAAAGAAAAAAAPALAAGLIIGGTTAGVVAGAAALIGLTAVVIANNDDASPTQ